MSKAAKIRKALQAGKSAKVIAQTLNVPVQSVYTEKWKMSKDKPAVKAKVMARRKKVILKAANKVFDKEYKKVVVEKKEPAQLHEMYLYVDDLVKVQNQIYELQSVEKFLHKRINEMNEQRWSVKE